MSNDRHEAEGQGQRDEEDALREPEGKQSSTGPRPITRADEGRVRAAVAKALGFAATLEWWTDGRLLSIDGVTWPARGAGVSTPRLARAGIVPGPEGWCWSPSSVAIGDTFRSKKSGKTWTVERYLVTDALWAIRCSDGGTLYELERDLLDPAQWTRVGAPVPSSRGNPLRAALQAILDGEAGELVEQHFAAWATAIEERAARRALDAMGSGAVPGTAERVWDAMPATATAVSSDEGRVDLDDGGSVAILRRGSVITLTVASDEGDRVAVEVNASEWLAVESECRKGFFAAAPAPGKATTT